jgi:ElaA protein
MQWCTETHPYARIRIGAQRYLSKFYGDDGMDSGLGFVNDGEPYDEDGIPHIDMVYSKHLE